MTLFQRTTFEREGIMQRYLVLVAWMIGLAAFAAGCGSDAASYRPIPKDVQVKDTQPPHEHGDHGPHGGHLVELGEEEYHAEVVLDVKSKAVNVYLLSSDPQKAAPVDAKEVVLELTIDGKTGPHVAKPSPQKDDPAGKSSRFILTDDPDIKAKIDDEHELEGHVKVVIKGKSYSGEITHEHGDHHEQAAAKKN
jgi:hypothetical protein